MKAVLDTSVLFGAFDWEDAERCVAFEPADRFSPETLDYYSVRFVTTA